MFLVFGLLIMLVNFIIFALDILCFICYFSIMKRITLSIPDDYYRSFVVRYGERSILHEYLRRSIYSAVSSKQLFDDIFGSYSSSSPLYNTILEVSYD